MLHIQRDPVETTGETGGAGLLLLRLHSPPPAVHDVLLSLPAQWNEVSEALCQPEQYRGSDEAP